MGTNKRNVFQLALLIFFGAAAVVGIIVLALYRAENNESTIRVPVTIWGPPLLAESVREVLGSIQEQDKSYGMVSYVIKNPYTMYSDLLEAIATDSGPDLVIYDAAQLLALKNKLYPISFETLPVATFRQTFVEGAEVFVLQDGTYGLPLLVDPLMLYWNRDIFTDAAIAEVPQNWSQFIQVTPRLSILRDGRDLVQSAIAFGEYENVNHATEIVSTLMMQAGVDLVTQNAKGEFTTDTGVLEVSRAAKAAALRFYTDFSNPVKTVYSWNKTFDLSADSFAADDLAMYAGLLSDAALLEQINPNLNYDIAVWPQSSTGGRKTTYGHFYGIGIVKDSGNIQPAFTVAWKIGNSMDYALILSEMSGLPTVHRAALNDIDRSDPFSFSIVQSALMARTWLQPGIRSVDEITRRMINDTVAQKATEEQAVRAWTQDLEVLLEQY